ncbi:MAG: hypothetical protein ABR543_10910 [Gemmatimonadaceae bacterium]
MPANAPAPHGPYGSPIAGSVLPIKRAEELLLTLPGVLAARIVAGETGSVDEIHLLTTTELSPKATVRNVESALMAHLGMRVDHRKISVATSVEAPKVLESQAAAAVGLREGGRRLYFEDVEVRRSRVRGVTCRVTLSKGDESFSGEAEGFESERSRAELAARATLVAIGRAETEGQTLALDGCKIIDAFDREFVFVGVTARAGRDTVTLSGSSEVKESHEIASVLATLDATNRWIGRTKTV